MDDRKGTMVNFSITLREKVDSFEKNFSDYIEKLVEKDLRRREIGQTESDVDKLINEAEAELLVLYNRRKEMIGLREIEVAFQNWPEDKKQAMIDHANKINKNYWQVVKTQLDFERIYPLRKELLYWRAGLSDLEMDQVGGV